MRPRRPQVNNVHRNMWNQNASIREEPWLRCMLIFSVFFNLSTNSAIMYINKMMHMLHAQTQEHSTMTIQGKKLLLFFYTKNETTFFVLSVILQQTKNKCLCSIKQTQWLSGNLGIHSKQLETVIWFLSVQPFTGLEMVYCRYPNISKQKQSH